MNAIVIDAATCFACSEPIEGDVSRVGELAYCDAHRPIRRSDFVRSPTSRCMFCKANTATYRSECLNCFSDRTGIEVLP